VNRQLRLLVVGLAVLLGGFALWALSGHLGWLAGENAVLWLIGCGLLAGCIVHGLLPKTSAGQPLPESMWIVDYDAAGVSCARPGAETQRVAWSELQRVEIITTDEGPWAADVIWVLHGASSGCVIPQGATGHKRLLERLQELPGFDNEAVIRAMASTSNDTFVAWVRRS
jgi:hypothetical protein